MNSSNLKVLFVAAIGFVLWGGYRVADSAYITMTWDRADGKVTGFERHVMSCGKGVGECYSLVVSYQVNGRGYSTGSVKKYDRSKPSRLLNTPAVVYYAPGNPGQAILGGAYGPMRYGIWLLLIGCAILFGFWVAKRRRDVAA